MATLRRTLRAMTTHATTSTTPATTPAAVPAGDPRPALIDAMRLAHPIVLAAQQADPLRPTPCTDLPLGDLLSHMAAVGARIVALGEGRPAASEPDAILAEDGDVAALWAASTRRAEQAWAQRSLDDTLVVPWRELTAAEAAAIYTSEVVAHTWDLARATGLPFAVDDEAITTVAIGAMSRELPSTGRAELFDAMFAQIPGGQEWSHPFAEVQPTAADATPLERLVALTGRDPNWTQPTSG